jgi:hypothetical protein
MPIPKSACQSWHYHFSLRRQCHPVQPHRLPPTYRLICIGRNHACTTVFRHHHPSRHHRTHWHRSLAARLHNLIRHRTSNQVLPFPSASIRTLPTSSADKVSAPAPCYSFSAGCCVYGDRCRISNVVPPPCSTSSVTPTSTVAERIAYYHASTFSLVLDAGRMTT